MKILVMYSSPFPYYVVPLRPKYSPEHPVLEKSQPTFLSRWKRPSFTPIRNDTENCSCVAYSLYFWAVN